ncbi:hypothetical protein P692DRAFT_20479666 [Suillus brevipes Sb2]|nr:hypothetical protein P692DRAFT_20479666 [Suillus brevipes Sb2]
MPFCLSLMSVAMAVCVERPARANGNGQIPYALRSSRTLTSLKLSHSPVPRCGIHNCAGKPPNAPCVENGYEELAWGPFRSQCDSI